MDIVTALAVLSPFPVDMHDNHLNYQGAYHPRMIPTQVLDQQQLEHHLLHGISSDPEKPAIIALSLNHQELAWRFLDGLPSQHNISANLDRSMRQWVQAQLTKHNIQSDGSHFYIKENAHNKLKTKRIIEKADNSVRSMLNAIQWPLWQGPLLIGQGEKTVIQAQPLLPSITLSKEEWNEAGFSAALCRLALLRYQKGSDQNIPEWITTGLSLVAQHKTEGSGPSPRRMLRLRQQAGKTAIKNMWDDTLQQAFDPELAKACCAPLVHTREKHKLASLLTLLHNQVDIEQAISIAYGRSLDSLLSKP
jgi:hypothetical protein